MGVVFLFAKIAKRLQFGIEEIRAAYPDCIAYFAVATRGRVSAFCADHSERSLNFFEIGFSDSLGIFRPWHGTVLAIPTSRLGNRRLSGNGFSRRLTMARGKREWPMKSCP